MFERFTPGARGVLVFAQAHSYRLEHEYTGAEHILLGLLSYDTPVPQVLDSHFISLSGVDRQVRTLTKLAPPDDYADADAANQAIIDAAAGFLGQIRAAGSKLADEPPRRFGRRSKPPVPGIPFTHHAKGVIERAVQLSLQRHDESLRAAHLAIGLLDTPECLAWSIIEASGVDLTQLRTALEATLEPSNNRTE